MSDKIRYGVLSTAQIARNCHVPSASKASLSEITAISSRDRKRAEEWAAKLDIPKAYGSYEELLSDPQIDAVINALPNSLHCEWTVKAARAGKHILCEKPIAVTVEEADAMFTAAEENNVLLMEGFTHRFTPGLQFMRKSLDTGAIGEIRMIRAELTYTLVDWATDARVKRELAGGSLLDAGCYCVNTVRHLMGEEPVSVQAYQRVLKSHQVDSTFLGMMMFPEERLGTIATGMEEPFRFCCEVIGTTGTLYAPNLFAGTTVNVTVNGQDRVEKFEGIDRFQMQIDHFSDCILNGRRPMISKEESMGNTAALAALAHAADAEKAIALGGGGS